MKTVKVSFSYPVGVLYNSFIGHNHQKVLQHIYIGIEIPLRFGVIIVLERGLKAYGF